MESTPSHRSECQDVVADYDYEAGLLPAATELAAEQAPEPTAPTRNSKYVTAVGIVAAVLVVIVIGAYVAYRSPGEEAGDVVQPTEFSFDDSFDSPPRRSAAALPPAPNPSPQEPTRPVRPMCVMEPPRHSYQATQLPEWQQPWPAGPGFEWVVGPYDLPPVIVEEYKVCWWWNWRTDALGSCGFYLEQRPFS